MIQTLFNYDEAFTQAGNFRIQCSRLLTKQKEVSIGIGARLAKDGAAPDTVLFSTMAKRAGRRIEPGKAILLRRNLVTTR